jgi:hypothetical protein
LIVATGVGSAVATTATIATTTNLYLKIPVA